ncbi:MAG TPA: hypothetical protein VHU80_01605 [Polyangiaceae bacterium]|jgi:hypothetical protein|nr:hypothetical protein [Polyangiaceae bacterium]
MVVSGLARAQDAQVLFDQGLADMKAGRFKIGCALIKQSLDVDARPGTVFTLAECYSRAGKYASAVSFYDHFLATFETMPKDQQEQQQARADISRTERTRLIAQVAWLTVILPPLGPPGVVVTLDGEEFPSSLFGIATATDPGAHVFTTRVPDGPLLEQRVDIAAGQRKAVQLDVGTSSSPTTDGANPEQKPPEGGPTKTHPLAPWMWASFGVGAAGAITATVAGVMLLQDRSKIMNECPPAGQRPDGSIPCKDDGYAAVQRARNTLAPLTTVGITVGAAGVAAGIILLITDASSSNRAQATTVPLFAVEPRGATLGFATVW